MEAMDFFQMSEGRWISQRTTHHLAMRRTELGQLEITASVLEATDPKVVEICQMHDVDPARAIGGAAVSWQGSMQWDEAGQTQEGATVLVLVPDSDAAQSGQLLREKGYAETSPVVGHYQVDDQDGLILTTDYSTMSSVERFWFPNATTRIRTSTVIGLSNTASFCVETRIDVPSESSPVSSPESAPEAIAIPAAQYSALGW
ncbi:phycobiliprotein lyase [Halomicronema sp. CCY15110]|uniref:phycobiliprotein lyase n=1 Tax=Halomicronema sp. CCY15110 TaxID=2767773 RepID=UPI001950BE17|nr:phycobiliprotein lyase [Halomicronema sp. CCY15110]